ncbi:hypothetical protein X735_30155 [Mesorhizobium sp. L2C085B000]|nr:hypothetical protein X735_30155 [Mesorhizobium sp. L2C085B000]
MNDVALPLSGLSSVGGKSVVARFDGGMLSSNSGVLALAEVEKRLRVAERLARCIDDPRCPDQVVHSLADMIDFRMKMIGAGYEDGNDANRLRRDPVFKMAQDALPSGRDLASQSTLCRLENLPGVRELVAMGRAMVDLYCASFRQVIDDPRCPDQVVHSLADMIGFRMKMIAAGYEDGNDANRLRRDPVFKMAQDALPSGRDLAPVDAVPAGEPARRAGTGRYGPCDGRPLLRFLAPGAEADRTRH